MSSLSPRLQVRVQQKQTLTPGLVQMVSLLQLNRLELKDMITAEIAQNPVLEEAVDGGEELTPEELQPLLEAEAERTGEPADKSILEATPALSEVDADAVEMPEPGEYETAGPEPALSSSEATAAATAVETAEAPAAADPFDEIDLGDYFDNYLDPGFKSPASESIEKPSFETFLSSPVTLSDHLQSQLSVLILPERVRRAANSIVGNLEESGYLTTPLEEIAVAEELSLADMQAGLKAVQSLDPTGVGARTLQECLLLQLDARGCRDGVAWKIVHDHLKLLESRQVSQLAKAMGRPLKHVQIALNVIQHLDPAPGLRYSGGGARQVEPDVYIEKEGDDYVITLNDDDIPQIRLNGEYKRMVDRDQEPNKEIRNYVKERYASALQLIKNIEQRKQTILRVCQSIVRRQTEF